MSRPNRTQLYAGIAAFAVLSLLYVSVISARRSAERRIGVSMERAPDGIGIASVAPGLPADRAGLRAGDVLMAIDGTPLANEADYDPVSATFERGDPRVFRVRRGEEILELTLAPGAELAWRDLVVNAAGAIAYLALGLLALFQARGDLRARLLCLFSLAVALELANPVSTIGNPALQTASRAFFLLLTGIQFGIEVHLASVIPRRRGFLERWPWVAALFYLVGLGIGGLATVAFLGERFGRQLLPLSSATLSEAMLSWGLPV
ncbi:MAG TPA: PDZ domain-containing protein, partial [Methylomirabilota bacterium]